MKKEDKKKNKEKPYKEAIFSEDELQENLTEEQLEKKGAKISDSRIYQLFVKGANQILHKPLTVFRILKKALARLQKYDSIREFATDAKERLQILIRLVQAYVKGDYRKISKVNAALSLAAILYFLSPLDLIPDFLPMGLVDDLALLTWVYFNFQGEVEEFLEWEEEHNMIRIEIKGLEDNK